MLPHWDIYPIFDPRTVSPDFADSLIAGGAAVMQLRMKGASREEVQAAAATLVPLCRDAGVDLIINDDPGLCGDAGADGVHLGQGDMSPAEARCKVGPEKIIGISTHSREQFMAALKEPVDYIAVGPIFGTQSKANPDPTVGLELLRWARTQTDRPLVAIGGITPETAPEVVSAGADVIAVISAVTQACDPRVAVEAIRSAWSRR